MINPYLGLQPLFRPDGPPAPIELCLLGGFQLRTAGLRVAVPSGSKLEALLAYLGLRPGHCIPREILCQLLWPNSEGPLASQSLRSLLSSLQHLLVDAISGVPLVVYRDGCYQLNAGIGLTIDTMQFDALLQHGEQQALVGDPAAEATFRQALTLYRGELHIGDADVQAVVVREHLRAQYLMLLMRLASYRFEQHDYPACVLLVQQILRLDPCFEHAHRLLMRCYVRLGNRSIALHHYRVCRDILHSAFATTPEPDTTALFDQIRLDAGTV
jgi:DNA-binding SARP family transcriptional activator